MKIIAIYPGRFQPFGKHHAESFKWLQSQFGANNSYIVTSNIVSLPKSPLNFKDKKDIITQYGLGKHVVNVKLGLLVAEPLATLPKVYVLATLASAVNPPVPV